MQCFDKGITIRECIAKSYSAERGAVIGLYSIEKVRGERRKGFYIEDGGLLFDVWYLLQKIKYLYYFLCHCCIKKVKCFCQINVVETSDLKVQLFQVLERNCGSVDKMSTFDTLTLSFYVSGRLNARLKFLLTCNTPNILP